MNKPTIEITISPEGDAKIEAQGFTGSDCKGATDPYVAAFGTPSSVTRKASFYVQPKGTMKREQKS